ncbi:MAG: hypothetical protein C4519_20620 [Desulfobacteraceae bacterium]|nr:MAG: hypothetical protein C4519_20620 [Desulfobacteraceae bacterium]
MECKEKSIPATENRSCSKKRIITVALALVGLLIWTGCTRKKAEEEYLIRVRSHALGLAEFHQAVEAAGEEAFAGDRNVEPAALNDLRMRILNQLTEELMIIAFAADHRIKITDEELDSAVNVIKADYPDATFEETLLENAVSFQFWRNQLATRLLIEKVIAKELIGPVQITTDDIAQYYHTNYPQGVPAGENADDINRRIVTHLRRQKAESAYKEWIEKLRQSYPVEINRQVWNKLIGETH